MAGTKTFPDIILAVGFDFDWDNEKVWALNYPTEAMDISELEWHFEIPFWDSGSIRYDLKPIDVINDKTKYEEQYERILQADLRYPIDIMMNKGKWTILDGLHRVLKAKILGLDKVSVRKIPVNEVCNIKI